MDLSEARRSLDNFLAWSVLGWFVGLAIPLGVAFVQMSETVFAKICFGFCGAALLTKLLAWGLTTKQAIGIRSLGLFLFAGCLTVLLVESFRWADAKVSQNETGGANLKPDGSPQSGTATSARLSKSFELTSPSEIELHFKTSGQPETEIAGVLVTIVNRGEYTLTACRLIVTSARSYNARRQSFRIESAGQGLAATITSVRPDDKSGGYWLLRVNTKTQQLEIGANIGQGFLRWPGKDPAQVQKWLFEVRLEATNSTGQLPNWSFQIRLDWTPPATLGIGNAS